MRCAVFGALLPSPTATNRALLRFPLTPSPPSLPPADACRLNVALTRARHHLIVVGCAPALQQSAPALAALVAACRSTPGGFSPHGRLGT